MGTALQIPFWALIGGVLAYFAVTWLAPQVPPADFKNVIGLAAVLSGALGGVVSRWRERRKAASKGNHG